MNHSFRFLPGLRAVADRQLLAPLRNQLFAEFPTHDFITELFKLQAVGYQ